MLWSASLFCMAISKPFFRVMGWNVIIIIIINLIFGFTIQGIDNAGHIGGLVGGFLATAIVHFPKKKAGKSSLVHYLLPYCSSVLELVIHRVQVPYKYGINQH